MQNAQLCLNLLFHKWQQAAVLLLQQLFTRLLSTVGGSHVS
jgi:hypothetical protein